MIRRSDAGMTLLEVVIASAILVIVATMAYMILFSASKLGNQQVSRQSVDDHREFFERSASEELSSGLVRGGAVMIDGTPYGLGIPPGGAEIRYQVPCGRGPGGSIVYGYPSPLPYPNNGPKAGLACFVRFEPEETFLESAVSPAPSASSALKLPFPELKTPEATVLNADINRDGDQSDAFLRGVIVKYVVIPDGHPLITVNEGDQILERTILAHRVVLAASPQDPSKWEGDVDGDGVLDPLYQFRDGSGYPVDQWQFPEEGGSIQMGIWTCMGNDAGEPWEFLSSIRIIRLWNRQG